MFKKLISIFSPKMLYNLNSALNQLFVTVLLIISIKSAKSMENLERLVIEHLLDGYNKDARPFVSEPPGGPVVVKVGIHLRQITELDVKNQVLESYLWTKFEWYDEELQWEAMKFGNLTEIRLPADQIWIPDLELYNSADDLTQLASVNYPAVVKSSGYVSIIEPHKIRSTCKMDVLFFRFGTQTCSLKIGSWTHHGFDMDLIQSETIDIDDLTNKGEFEIIKSSMAKNVNQYDGFEDFYVDVTVTLVIKQRSLFFVLDTIVPFILVSILMVFTFKLRVDKNLGLRLVVGLTAFVVFCTFLWHETGYVSDKPGPIPLIVLYMTLMMVLSMITVFGTLFVWKLGLVGPNALLYPKCVDCVASSGSYTVKDDMRDSIPLSDYGFMDTANVQEVASVSSLVLLERERAGGGGGSTSNQTRGEREQRDLKASTYLTAAMKLDRILFWMIGSLVMCLNVGIILIAIFK